MYICEGRFCRLEELTTGNAISLFNLISNNRLEYQRMVSGEIIPASFDCFELVIRAWFQNGRMYQFLVYNRFNIVIGTIFFYISNKRLRRIKVSCFFDRSARNRIIVPEALGLSINFTLTVLNRDSLVFDVYEENILMHILAQKVGARKIGRKKSAFDKSRNVTIYLLDREIVGLINEKILHLENTKRSNV